MIKIQSDFIKVYNRPGQTIDRDRPVDRQQFGGRSQIFLIQKKLIKIEGCYLFMVGVTSLILS